MSNPTTEEKRAIFRAKAQEGIVKYGFIAVTIGLFG